MAGHMQKVTSSIPNSSCREKKNSCSKAGRFYASQFGQYLARWINETQNKVGLGVYIPILQGPKEILYCVILPISPALPIIV